MQCSNRRAKGLSRARRRGGTSATSTSRFYAAFLTPYLKNQKKKQESGWEDRGSARGAVVVAVTQRREGAAEDGQGRAREDRHAQRHPAAGRGSR